MPDSCPSYGLDGLRHVEVIEQRVGTGIIDVVLVNSRDIPEENLTSYRQEGAEPVLILARTAEAHGIRLVGRDLLAEGNLVRHDPIKLCDAILELVGR